MGFFDEYQESQGPKGDFIGREEKQSMIDNAVPFTITDLTLDSNSQFGERYVAKVKVDSDPEAKDRLISFQTGSVESRDRMLASMATYLESTNEDFPRAVLTKVGRSILLQPAE